MAESFCLVSRVDDNGEKAVGAAEIAFKNGVAGAVFVIWMQYAQHFWLGFKPCRHFACRTLLMHLQTLAPRLRRPRWAR